MNFLIDLCCCFIKILSFKVFTTGFLFCQDLFPLYPCTETLVVTTTLPSPGVSPTAVSFVCVRCAFCTVLLPSVPFQF